MRRRTNYAQSPTLGRRLRLIVNLCLWSLVWNAQPAIAAPVPDDYANQLPELGDASSRTISPQLEKQIGGEFLKQIHAGLPTVDDPILKYYVRTQLAGLAQHSLLNDNLLSTVLIDDEQINAFAAPGGVVGINLGLMLYAEDVHEYSAVLAHELAHLSQRHFARGVEEQRAQTLPTLASLIAALMIGVAGGGDAGIAAISAAQAAAQAKQLKYSRTREQEADRIGLNTLVRGNMDPNAMGRMFERMQRAYRFTRRPPEFLLTHPLSDTRIADARAQAQAYPTHEFKDSLDYELMRVRAQVHFAPSASAAVKTFRRRAKETPDDPATRYGLALALSNVGEDAEAIALADSLYSTDRNKILLISTYAEILINAAKTEQATRLLTRQLVINPDNPAMSMLYARALTEAKDYEEAEAVLKRQSIVRPNDVDVWYNLAEVAGLAGNIVGVHLARADYFALHGAYSKAIQHLQYARRLVAGDNTQLVAKLDQRIIDLRDALRARS